MSSPDKYPKASALIGRPRYVATLCQADVDKLSRKEKVIAWLRSAPEDMIFAPNSTYLCVLGRMYTDLFDHHDFRVYIRGIRWDATGYAKLSIFAERFQDHLEAYCRGRDGTGEKGNCGSVSRDEAIKVAIATPARWAM